MSAVTISVHLPFRCMCHDVLRCMISVSYNYFSLAKGIGRIMFKRWMSTLYGQMKVPAERDRNNFTTTTTATATATTMMHLLALAAKDRSNGDIWCRACSRKAIWTHTRHARTLARLSVRPTLSTRCTWAKLAAHFSGCSPAATPPRTANKLSQPPLPPRVLIVASPLPSCTRV